MLKKQEDGEATRSYVGGEKNWFKGFSYLKKTDLVTSLREHEAEAEELR